MNRDAAIAIVGMSGRFPGAANLEEFWANLENGVESISFFTDEELAPRTDPATLQNPGFVKARGIIQDPDLFDAQFFGYTPREAERMDPQHRIFLETCHEALEDAGYDPERYTGLIGVYGGCEDSVYLQARSADDFEIQLLNSRDFLCTRVGYKLNLRGPAVTVQSACSTSLAAVHLACQSLLTYQCDMALSGGVAIRLPQKAGYWYRQGGTLSPDGHTRPFDKDANGSAMADGAGVLALKRLTDAAADGDNIYAVILGSALNNDGSGKVSYTAPGVQGQQEAISAAISIADISPATIGYVEAHGAGSPLGDVAELEALTSAFGDSGKRGFCAIGSLKSNIGHAAAAAGVAGLIKTVLALRHRKIAPTLHFKSPNPEIDFASGPFYVNTELRHWPVNGTPRRAGVNSFGIGGTNVHLILEEAPSIEQPAPSGKRHVLTVSAKSLSALDSMAANLAEYLEKHAELDLADISYTLRVGRRQFAHRRTVVCRDIEEAVRLLRSTRTGRGEDIDQETAAAGEKRRRVSLPTYPFERQSYWIEPESATPTRGANAYARPALSSPYAEPRTDIERSLAAIWEKLIGVRNLGIDDDFFELGGHSLLAMRLIDELAVSLHIEIGMATLAECPTIRKLAERAGGRASAGPSPVLAPVLAPDRERRFEPFPLTDVQQAYWLGRSEAFELGNIATQGYFEIEVRNPDTDRFARAWQSMVARHEMLRTVVESDATQRILPDVPTLNIPLTDLRRLTEPEREEHLELVRRTMSRQTLPADRWPLFEIRVSRLSDETARIHFAFDALIADVHSLSLLLDESGRLYDDPDCTLPPLELSFRDYVLAEQALRESDLYRRAETYWLDRISALPAPPELPLACDPGSIRNPQFQGMTHMLETHRWEALQAKSRRAGLTASAVLLTAFSEVLAAWSRRPQFTLNLSLFHRLPVHPQVNEIVGDFTSLTLFGVDLTGQTTFVERARRTQQQLWRDLDHSHFSGVRVLRELARRQGGPRKAVAPVVFTSTLGLGAVSPTKSSAQTLGETVFAISQTPQVWLDHGVAEREGALLLIWNAIPELFPAGMLDEMFAAYRRYLERLADSDETWSETSARIVPATQMEQRAAINATAKPLSGELLHSLFARRAEEQPDAVAVIASGRSLRYRELWLLAGRVGWELRNRGALPNALVAVVLEKGWEQVAAVFGVLTSGAAYLPIDPGLPDERRENLLARGEVRLVLTTRQLRAGLSWPPRLEVLCIEDLEELGGKEPPPSVQGEDDLAYVIFTSGSTGEPKGVMIDHRGAVNTVLDINHRFGVCSSDSVLALSALNFDLSVYDIFGLLAAGGTVVMPAPGRDREPGYCLDLIRGTGVTIWNTVPALMQMLVEYAAARDTRFDSLRLCLLSGDWVPVNLPAQVRDRSTAVKVISLGGATEASIWSIFYPIEQVDPEWKSVPYGRPLSNQNWHVLDSRMRPCPVWTPGNLYIGGVGLARGYWRDPAKTLKSFVPHPETGELLYRTGDLGRYLPDGDIEFLGREDFQVKIGGHRIELGEIEATLLQHEAVREAIVAAVGEPRGEKQLAAWIVTRAPGSSDTDRAREKTIHDPAERVAFKLGKPGNRSTVGTQIVAELARPALNGSARRVFLERQSYRKYGSEPISRERFGSFLGCLAEMEYDGAALPKRRYPSAGSLYPVQAYISIKPGRVEGIDSGIYYYNPERHTLDYLGPRSDQEEGSFGYNENLYKQSAFGIFFFAKMAAIAPLYENMARDFCLLEAGYMGQLLTGSSAAHGIGLCPIGHIDLGRMAEGFRLEPDQPWLHALLGGPIDPEQTEKWEPEGYENSEPLPLQLRKFLQRKLPAYMVPASFSIVDALPLTANGKVDRKSLLLAPASPDPVQRPARAPKTGLERAVGEIVQRVLNKPQIGMDTNFFDLGANSLHIVRIQNEINKVLGREVPIVDMFRNPTVDALAAFLGQSAGSAGHSLPGDGALQDVLDRAATRKSERRRRTA